MKKIIHLLFTLVLLNCIYKTGIVYATDGYTISSAEELYSFANMVNEGQTFEDAIIYLLEDIDLNGNADNQWIPIGSTSQKSFKGLFEGNGHIISGLYIDNPKYDNLGLFGYNNGTIQNLGITNSYMNINTKKTSVNMGFIAGVNAGLIQCSYNDSNLDTEVKYSNAYTYIGGIARCWNRYN